MEIAKVAVLIKKASLEFERVSNPFFSKYGLTPSQYRVLKYLYSRPEGTARIVDIERQYSMTHPTTLGLVDALEKKGFTFRTENPDDARGKLVALTEKARSMRAELEKIGDEIESKLTEKLSQSEKEQLVSLLLKLTEEGENR